MVRTMQEEEYCRVYSWVYRVAVALLALVVGAFWAGLAVVSFSDGDWKAGLATGLLAVASALGIGSRIRKNEIHIHDSSLTLVPVIGASSELMKDDQWHLEFPKWPLMAIHGPQLVNSEEQRVLVFVLSPVFGLWNGAIANTDRLAAWLGMRPDEVSRWNERGARKQQTGR